MNRPRRRGVLLWAPGDVARLSYTVPKGDRWFHCTLISQVAPRSTQVTAGVPLTNPEWNVRWHGHAGRSGIVKQTSLRRVDAPPPADESDDGWEGCLDSDNEDEEEQEEEAAARRKARAPGGRSGATTSIRVSEEEEDEEEPAQRKRRRVEVSDDEDDNTYAPPPTAQHAEPPRARAAAKATVKAAAPPPILDTTGRRRGRDVRAYDFYGERAHWSSSGEGARAHWSSSGEGARGGVGAYADRFSRAAPAQPPAASSSAPAAAAATSVSTVFGWAGPKRLKARKGLAALIGGEPGAANALAEKLDAAIYAQACASGTAHRSYPKYELAVRSALPRGGAYALGPGVTSRAQLLEGRHDPVAFVAACVARRAPDAATAVPAPVPVGASLDEPALPALRFPTFEEFRREDEAFGRAVAVDELDELQRLFHDGDDGGAFALEVGSGDDDDSGADEDGDDDDDDGFRALADDVAPTGAPADGVALAVDPTPVAPLNADRPAAAAASDPTPGATVAVAATPGAALAASVNFDDDDALVMPSSTALEGIVVIVALDEALVLQPSTSAYPLCEAYVREQRASAGPLCEAYARERRASAGFIVTDNFGFNIVVRDGAGAFLRQLRAAGARVVGATALRTWPAQALANISGDAVWDELEVRGLPSSSLVAATDATLREIADAGTRHAGERGAPAVLVHAGHIAVASGVSLPCVKLEPWDERALKLDTALATGAAAAARSPRFDEALAAVLRLAPRLAASNAEALARAHAAAVGDVSHACAAEQLREIWWRLAPSRDGGAPARLWRTRALARGAAELVEKERRRGLVGLIQPRISGSADAGDIVVRPLRQWCRKSERLDWGEFQRVSRDEIDSIEAWLDPRQSMCVTLDNNTLIVKENIVDEEKYPQAPAIGVCPKMRLVAIGWLASTTGGATNVATCPPIAEIQDVKSALKAARDANVPKVLMRWLAEGLPAAEHEEATFAEALAVPAAPFSHVCQVCAAHGSHKQFRDLCDLEQHMKDAGYGHTAPPHPCPPFLAHIYAMGSAQEVGAARGRGRGRGGRQGGDRGRGYSGSPGGATARLGDGPNDWHCRDCSYVNFARRHDCNRCGAPRADMNCIWADQANRGRGGVVREYGAVYPPPSTATLPLPPSAAAAGESSSRQVSNLPAWMTAAAPPAMPTPAAVPQYARSGQAGWEAAIVAKIKACGGMMTLSTIGNVCPKPAGVKMRLKHFITARPKLFTMDGDYVKLK